MITSVLLFLTTTIAIAWSFPFILCPLIGLQFYVINDNKLTKLLKRMKKLSSLSRNDEADGWIVGYPFIGYVYSTSTQYEDKKELYLFTTIKYFNEKNKEIELIGSDEVIPKENPININIYEKEGSFSYVYYGKRVFNLDYFEPRIEQTKIINNIIEIFEKKRNCVTILYGEKGTGKSMIPLLLAKELSTRYSPDEDNMIKFCDTFKPTDPGDSFVSLYNRTSPNKNSPLIVVLEEFDIIVHDIHHNNIQPHKEFPILIKNKPTWNQFFDRFDRRYFPWTIFIMTTNMHPDYINNMDLSYIREGRVDSIYNVVGDK